MKTKFPVITVSLLVLALASGCGTERLEQLKKQGLELETKVKDSTAKLEKLEKDLAQSLKEEPGVLAQRDKARESLRLAYAAAGYLSAPSLINLELEKPGSCLTDLDWGECFKSTYAYDLANFGRKGFQQREYDPLSWYLWIDRSCSCEEEGDGSDESEEDLSHCGCGTNDGYDPCADIPTRLEALPGLDQCKLFEHEGYPTSAFCEGSKEDSASDLVFRVGFIHKGELYVSEYPTPSVDNYFPYTEEQRAACMAKAERDSCIEECNPDFETTEDCLARCRHENDASGESEEEMSDADYQMEQAERKMAEAEAEMCEARCEKDYENAEGDDNSDDPPGIEIDHRTVEKVYSPTPGVYVINYVHLEGFQLETPAEGEEEEPTELTTHAMLLVDEHMRLLADKEKLESADGERLHEEAKILSGLKLSLDVQDKREVDSEADYMRDTVRKTSTKDHSIHQLQLDPFGKVFVASNKISIKAFASTEKEGAKSFGKIDPSVFCQALRASTLEKPEELIAACEKIPDPTTEQNPQGAQQVDGGVK